MSRRSYQFGLAIGMAGVMLALSISAESTREGLLTGTVRSTAGAPVEGVAVSAQIAGEPITTSVYTAADGRYFFPPMKEGRYKVWAQAIGLERNESTTDLGDGTKRLDFSMKKTTDIIRQLSGYQVMAALPEDTRAHRRGKVLFQKMCTYCHESSTAMRDRFDQHGWETIVRVMTGGFNPANTKPLTPPQMELATYLTEMRGPGPSPMKPQVFRPKGEATLAAVYEYDVEYEGGGYSAHNGSDWRYGQASSAGGNGAMHDATIDDAGNLWFTAPSSIGKRTVARVDRVTGKVTDFAVPLDKGPGVARAHGIYRAADGTIYFNASPRIAYLDGTLGMIDAKAQKVESLAPPSGMTLVSGWLGGDSKGYVWTASGTTKQGAALRFDPRTKTFTQFLSPTAGLTYGVAGDADGNGWWMGVNDDVVVHGDAATGKITEIRLPAQPPAEYVKPGDFEPGEEIPQPGIGGKQSPRRPYADLRGTALWVPNFYGNTMVRIDTRSKAVKYYSVPYPAMNPYEAAVDSKGRVWLTFQNSDELGRFDPASNAWTMYSYPTRGMAQRQNHMYEKDGVLQFISASGPSHRVGRFVIRSAQDVQALRSRTR
jgi:streptogramin lyase